MRISVMLAFLLICVLNGLAESADFHCAGGDVRCLMEAIEASNGNGQDNTIHLDAGIYSFSEQEVPVPPVTSGRAMTVTGRISILGSTASTTIIERAPTSQAFFGIFAVASTGTLVLDGVTVRGGRAIFGAGSGGAVSSSGTVTIVRSVITQNAAVICGAISHAGTGLLTIRDSRISQNAAWIEEGPGGILCIGRSGSPSVIIDRTTLSGNFPLDGYVIDITKADSVLIQRSTISGNEAHGPIISGAIRVTGVDEMAIVNTTIANNRFSRGGCEVEVFPQPQGTVRITNSTIALNTRSLSAEGGVCGPAQVSNTVVAGNLERDCGSPIQSLGHNLIGNPAGCGPLLSSDLTGDAGLEAFVDTGRPGGGIFRLRPDSRAIDAGGNVLCDAADQQELARPIDGNGDGVRICDIGAAEFYPVVNELVELAALNATYLQPPTAPGTLDPLVAGGEFRITAAFRNRDGRDICHAAVEVVTLQGQSGALPVLLSPTGSVLGSQGVILPATLTDVRFRIGLTEREPITFFVNVRGEATANPCTP